MKKVIYWLIAMSLFSTVPIFANDVISKSPEGAKLYFISPENGTIVSERFKVRFGLSGMGVAPAGVNFKNTGHHHLLIDLDDSEIDLTKPLPSTSKIRHFGGGQTETLLTLPKGEHTLQLLLGNYAHIPHQQPVFSEKIVITVQ